MPKSNKIRIFLRKEKGKYCLKHQLNKLMLINILVVIIMDKLINRAVKKYIMIIA